MKWIDCLDLPLSEKPLVVVVNGYGTILNSPLGDIYLPRVRRVIEEQKPKMVILCGGRTFLKTMPKDSEASVMEKWIMENLAPEYHPPLGFRADDTSYTTLRNCLGAAYFMQVQAWRFWSGGRRGYFRVIHCCEATRAPHVIMLDRHVMIDKFQLVDSIDDITVETASWERADPFKQAYAMIRSRVDIKYPWLHLADREHEKRIKASKNR